MVTLKKLEPKIFVNFNMLNDFMIRNLKGIEKRMQYYNFHFSELSNFILKRSGNIGFRPQVHTETKILERVKSKGFGNQIENLSTKTKTEFQDSVTSCISKINSKKVQKYDKAILFRAINQVIDKCLFPKDKFATTSLQTGLDNLNSSSGCGFGYVGTKGQNKVEILQKAKRLINSTDGKFLLDLPLIFGYRLQIREDAILAKQGSNSLSHKIRIIFMYPGHYTLVESIFALPFIFHFLTLGSESFYTIGKIGRTLGKQLKRRLSSKKRSIISLDASAWDQTLPNWLIIAAFAVLRNQLKLTKLESLLFDSVTQYFCSSPCLFKIDNKQVFIKNSGLPSGSYFTNLIGTICHAILLAYIDEETVSNNNFILCSDDNIFATDNPLDYYIDKYLTIFGININKNKSDVYSNLKEFNFLGYIWINFKRHINLKLAINQCIYHSEFRVDLNEYDRIVSRSASVLLNGYNGIPVFKKLFPEIIQDINLGKDPMFNYMYSYLPPTNNPVVTGIQPKASRVRSLSLHLKEGPDIR